MPTLLIIDDDVDMLSSLTDVLSQAGYDVAGAGSGSEAIVSAESRSPDLVISDVRMAGMDGIQCIQKLSEGRPALKSIVITGYASDDVPARAMDLATCDYLFKPFTAEQLIQSVERALSIPEDKPAPSYPAHMQQTALALAEMEATRKRAFQNFYLGVRSGHLGAAASLAVWDHLETVETRHLELERQLQLRLEVVELKDSYVSVSECCKSPTSPLIAAHKRKEGGISRIAFQPFIKNIREGRISSEQVKSAVYARDRAQDQANASADDQELYSLLWT